MRTCDNCCGTDHTARICDKPRRCGVCCSSEHTTTEHRCGRVDCEFYDSHPPAGVHCKHTELKCPHCGGAHAVRDAQCKVWQQRRNALRKPHSEGAKTGGKLRPAKSHSEIGPKGKARAVEPPKAKKTAGVGKGVAKGSNEPAASTSQPNATVDNSEWK